MINSLLWNNQLIWQSITTNNPLIDYQTINLASLLLSRKCVFYWVQCVSILWLLNHVTENRKCVDGLSAGAHLVFLRSCNTVAFLQENKYIFVEWIFTFTHVWRTTKNPLIYLLYPTSNFTATCCSKVQYDTIRFF